MAMRVRAWSAAVVILMGAAASGGCGSPASLEVDSCLKDLTPGVGEQRITPISCEGEHFGQVVAIFVADDGPFPGAEALLADSEQFCKDAFAKRVGSPVEESTYDLFPLIPSEDSWTNQKDRQVLCVVGTSAKEPLVGPISGPMS